MNNIHTLTCSKRKYLSNGLQIEVEIESNPYQLDLTNVFLPAGRINKKRAFLFVSKLLGKHLPINPKIGILTGAILAERYSFMVNEEDLHLKDSLKKAFLSEGEEQTFPPNSFIAEYHNPVIIGFAETATALGHAFFECFQNADFFHTTREDLLSLSPVITFEEEHSHATSHRCYVDEELLNNKREIILVDDELTTGNTAINIIRSIQAEFPRETYTVVSILDWRSTEHQEAFTAIEAELGISINCVSLIQGKMKAMGEIDLENSLEPEYRENMSQQKITVIPLNGQFTSEFTAIHEVSTTRNQLPYLYETGRFGIKGHDYFKINEWLKTFATQLKKKRAGEKTLCLGTGEFMYLPMKVASLMGRGVKYHSTTRSPIYPKQGKDYGANWKLEFPNPEDPLITNFVYNIPPNGYDDIFLFFEREVSMESLKPLLNQLHKTGINDIKIIFFSSVG